MMKNRTAWQRDVVKRDFTMIDLLVVISIIVMPALLLPALGHACAMDRATHCISNQKQLALAITP